MENLKSCGNIRITGTLNAKTGEYWFDVASVHGTRSTRSKCLFDALSDYGISYDKAKELVVRYSVPFSKTLIFESFPSDYYKNLPQTRPAKKIDKQ
jgi:hypothetical protein